MVSLNTSRRDVELVGKRYENAMHRLMYLYLEFQGNNGDFMKDTPHDFNSKKPAKNRGKTRHRMNGNISELI
jgi:hypothetical protein